MQHYPPAPFPRVLLLSPRFYFDRTHKGNDWNAVKSRLSADISAGRKSEKAATKEMLALLKDKYSRCVGGGAAGRTL